MEKWLKVETSQHKGDIVDAYKEQTSAPQAPHMLRSQLPELPTIRVTATELRDLYKSCKGNQESF